MGILICVDKCIKMLLLQWEIVLVNLTTESSAIIQKGTLLNITWLHKNNYSSSIPFPIPIEIYEILNTTLSFVCKL